MLISVLLIFLLFAVLQVALFVYARNVVSAAASDGAGYSANQGIDPADGGSRAAELIRKGLGSRNAVRIPCSGSAATDAPSGLAVTQVRCHGRLKMIFTPLLVPLTIDVRARAVKEGP